MSQEPINQFEGPERNLFDEIFGSMSEESSPESGQESISLANTNDQASREDWLGFAPYVTAIAEFLTSADTKPPLAMSVEGEWGTGKTSFMRQLEQALRIGRKQRFTVWFNPWRHDKEDAVWAAFALEFVRSISRSQWFWRRWWGHLRLFARQFRWEQGWLDFSRKFLLWILVLTVTVGVGVYGFASRGIWTQQIDILAMELTSVDGLQNLISSGLEAGGVIAYLSIWLTLLNKLTGFFGDPLKIDLKKYIQAPNYRERVSFVERFHEDFQHIVEAYAGKETVYVFIDDVDRCEVPKAADLMSALNLMISGDARLVFIIGMDREKVAAGLAVKHEKLLPFLHVSRYDSSDDQDKDSRIRLMGLEFGYEFIEKFVQLPFIVPRPDDVALGNFLRKISGEKEEMTVNPPAAPIRVRNLLGGTSTTGTSLSPTPVETPSQRQRRESIKIQAGTDSSRIHNIIRVVAPAFENNPRRLKQFINLFRLRVYIAAETGLFDHKQAPDNEFPIYDERSTPATLSPLTLEQLGKFVAINLRWPLLLADMEYAPSLLNDLQRLSLDAKIDPKTLTTPMARLSRWRHRPDLLSFLAAGISVMAASASSAKNIPSRWSLENVDFAEIMRVSPRVRRVVGEESVAVKTPVKGQTGVSPVSPAHGRAELTRVTTTYVFGDDLYDDSFSIDSPTGEFLGEMGVGSSNVIFPGEPKKFGAFEVWLFDKNDIKTQTKVLVSEFAFSNAELRARVDSRGELVLIKPGDELILETLALRIVVAIREVVYGRDSTVPANAYFDRLAIELKAFRV